MRDKDIFYFFSTKLYKIDHLFCINIKISYQVHRFEQTNENSTELRLKYLRSYPKSVNNNSTNLSLALNIL